MRVPFRVSSVRTAPGCTKLTCTELPNLRESSRANRMLASLLNKVRTQESFNIHFGVRKYNVQYSIIRTCADMREGDYIAGRLWSPQSLARSRLGHHQNGRSPLLRLPLDFHAWRLDGRSGGESTEMCPNGSLRSSPRILRQSHDASR